MNNLNEILPVLIPLIIIELILLIVTLRHILTHTNYKYGNRTIWLLVTIIGMNLIGPVLYFLFGKEET